MDIDKHTFAAHIGLDWADTKHDFCLKANDNKAFEWGVITHSPEAIEAWALALQKRFNGQPVAICLELKSGPVVNALLKYSFIVLFPIPPKALAKYREAFTQSGAKDDPSDAWLQLDYLIKHKSALRVLNPDTPETRAVQRLVEDRRTLIQDKVRLTNRLTAALKNYYPQPLEWFDDIDTQLFCKFITRWPDLKKAKNVRKKTLEEFFRINNSARQTVIDRRCHAIKDAMALTQEQAVIDAYSKLVLALVRQLSVLLETIHDYDLDIAQRYRNHADHAIFSSLPGAGPVFGPRLLAVFGTDRTRFESAEEVSRVTGIAPVLERSGKKSWVHWRYSCSKFIRQTLVEWANKSIRYSFWAREFYDKKRAKGLSHQSVLRTLAFKWIRILFRCWKDKTPYDESKYLFALKKRTAVTKTT